MQTFGILITNIKKLIADFSGLVTEPELAAVQSSISNLQTDLSTSQGNISILQTELITTNQALHGYINVQNLQLTFQTGMYGTKSSLISTDANIILYVRGIKFVKPSTITFSVPEDVEYIFYAYFDQK